jgi:branched-chain amino acid aminotransferase
MRRPSRQGLLPLLNSFQMRPLRAKLLSLQVTSTVISSRDSVRLGGWYSTQSGELNSKNLVVEKTTSPKSQVPPEKLTFGTVFTDHMLSIKWNKTTGWDKPHVHPYRPLQLDPASSVFHYGIECYEGMKAYSDEKGQIRLFRPLENMKRFNKSATRLCLPNFNEVELLECIKELIRIDKDWVPKRKGYSLYVRPCFIGTHAALGVGPSSDALLFVIASPVGPYYRTGWKPVRLLADTPYVRAWPGGTGNTKVGGNYGPTVIAQREAEAKGYNQILWLLGKEKWVTEVGTMNMFVAWRNKQGRKELVTSPVSDQGVVLAGVTRDSILQLVRGWDDWDVVVRDYTIHEIVDAHNEGRLLEAFGAGTAAVVSPIQSICFQGKEYGFPLGSTGTAGDLTQKISEKLLKIQYGETPSDWSVVIC